MAVEVHETVGSQTSLRRVYSVFSAIVVVSCVCVPCNGLKLNPVVNKSQKSDIFAEKKHFQQAFEVAFHFVEENWDDIDWSDPKLDIMEYSKLGELQSALRRWNAIEQKFADTINGNQQVGDSEPLKWPLCQSHEKGLRD